MKIRLHTEIPIDELNIICRDLGLDNVLFKLENDRPPLGFKSDGCSQWWDAIWVECCFSHDLPYYTGGTSQERKQADIDLACCVFQRVANWKPVIGPICGIIVASAMYIGVRIGGVPWLPTPFRWGFGWPWAKGRRGYGE